MLGWSVTTCWLGILQWWPLWYTEPDDDDDDDDDDNNNNNNDKNNNNSEDCLARKCMYTDHNNNY